MLDRYAAALLPWLYEIVQVLFAALAGLVAVGQVHPHLAVLLVLAMNAFVTWFVLPKPSRLRGELGGEEVAAYRLAQRALRTRALLRVVLWFFGTASVLVLSNALAKMGVLSAGLAAEFFSIAFGMALVGETLATIVRADALFRSPVEAVHRLFGRHDPPQPA